MNPNHAQVMTNPLMQDRHLKKLQFSCITVMYTEDEDDEDQIVYAFPFRNLFPSPAAKFFGGLVRTHKGNVSYDKAQQFFFIVSDQRPVLKA